MNQVGDVVRTLLVVALFTLAPAAVCGAITAGFVRTWARTRELSPAETERKVRAGFWIGAIVGLAVVLVLLGICISALNGIG